MNLELSNIYFPLFFLNDLFLIMYLKNEIEFTIDGNGITLSDFSLYVMTQHRRCFSLWFRYFFVFRRF